MVAEIVRPAPGLLVPSEVRERIARFNPRTDLGAIIKRVAVLLPKDDALELIDTVARSVVIESSLRVVHFRAYLRTVEFCDHLWAYETVERARCIRCDARSHVEDHGIVSRKVITTAGVNFLVDAWQGSVEMENVKYHGYGTGSNAEAVGNTALHTELTTEYATDNTRPTGTLAEGASANIFSSVATLSPNAGGTIAVTEHGLFDQASNAGGTLWDKSLFSAVNVVASADSLQTTYQATCSAGG